jgi:hypothetical protein
LYGVSLPCDVNMPAAHLDIIITACATLRIQQCNNHESRSRRGRWPLRGLLCRSSPCEAVAAAQWRSMLHQVAAQRTLGRLRAGYGRWWGQAGDGAVDFSASDSRMLSHARGKRVGPKGVFSILNLFPKQKSFKIIGQHKKCSFRKNRSALADRKHNPS